MEQFLWLLQEKALAMKMDGDAAIFLPLLAIVMLLLIRLYLYQNGKRKSAIAALLLTLAPLPVLVAGIASVSIQVPTNGYCRAYRMLDQFGRQALQQVIKENNGDFTFSCISRAAFVSSDARREALSAFKTQVTMEKLNKCDLGCGWGLWRSQ